jgi:diguanylate cyclase (GGDEF)-like protein
MNMIMGGNLLTGLIINLIVCTTFMPYHLYQVISLLSELDAMHEAMHNKSIHDELTQAYNRHFLQDTGLLLKNESAEIQKNTSVLLVDLDDFKAINDKHGHKTGDEVLKLLADTCHSLFRSTDIFIRYGGDEFICILPETNMEQALEIAQRIQNQIKLLTIPVRGGKVKFMVSIGVATANAEQNLEKLISLADKALYKAKNQGKNRVNAN